MTDVSNIRINAVIFDMDGLLIDSERIALATFQSACDHKMLGDQLALYQEILGTNTNHTITTLTAAFEPKGIDTSQFMSEWMDNYRTITTQQPVPLMKGAKALLAYLDDIQVPAAVATSTDTDLACKKLEMAGIYGYFRTITGGDQVANSKPEPDIYLKAAGSIDSEPTHSLALEDSPNGVRAATSAGMQVIQIPDLVQPDEALLELGHQVKPDLLSVRDWLRDGNVINAS